MDHTKIDWAAIAKDPKFIKLEKKKGRFLFFAMLFSVSFYCLLPIGAGYFPKIFNIKLWQNFNFATFFALSQFVVAWIIAFVYTRKANGEFDAMAEEIVNESLAKYGLQVDSIKMKEPLTLDEELETIIDDEIEEK